MISEKPSLYLKPEAYKASVLYCQLPEGTIGNMVFARTSVATRLDKNGLVEEVATGIPRLDYENGSCPELLLEPTRTNICLRSEEFENASWIDNSQMTVTANTSVSPDGTKNADKIVYVDNGTDGTVTQNITVADATKYELSIWMKGQKGGEKVRIDFSSTTAGTNGTEVTLTSKWVRYTENLLSDATARGFSIRCLTGSNDQTFYTYGSQLELGDYGTSYIKTTTVSVTRATETLNSGGDSTTFNSLEGVLYCELQVPSELIASSRIATSNDSTTDRVLLTYTSTSGQITFQSYVGNSLTCNISSTGNTRTDFLKIALKWKLNDYALWINGIEVGTDTGAVWVADTLTKLHFDNGAGAGSSAFHGRCRELRVYKTALTDTELTELTTL